MVLIAMLFNLFPFAHRKFKKMSKKLYSAFIKLNFKNRNPNWDLLGLENLDEVSNLPSVQWKVMHLKNMDFLKHAKALNKLKTVLYPMC